MSPAPTVAVFRPDDGRLAAAAATLSELGLEPLGDPMLAVEPTGAAPREDAAITVFTSATGVERAAAAGWTPGDGLVCAIGATTADRLREAGYPVDRVPAEYSSAGLVETLRDEAAGARVELARSDHGSATLPEGLIGAGAYVHETVLYRLVRPAESGRSTVAASEGALDGAVFTSSLTVEHFLAAAAERDVREAAIAALDGAVVGAIGEPTRETAAAAGIGVDVVPERASFEALASGVADRLAAEGNRT